MEQHEIEAHIKNIANRTERIEQILPTLATKADLEAIADRTKRIEQILPTLATKEDLKAFASKEDLKAFATKEDLKAFATKEDLKAYATKEDLKAYPTKEDLKAYPTRNEVKTMIQEDGERTRRHFDIVAEEIRASVEKIAEGHGVLDARIEGVHAELKTDLDKHERRIARLEVERRRK
jgi:hypothetical protein